ncbi:MAG: hypothetical protein F2625_00335, partial [Actinobacteria bacterium]|nr:hypothetical protein [Actinomycetota bacterium]
MTEPTPPIAFRISPDAVGEQFAGGSSVDDSVIEQLKKVCSTSVDDADRAEHGRDWWPL